MNLNKNFKQIIKRIYQALPLKKMVFIMLKWFWTPPKSIYQHLTFNDTFRIKISNKEHFQMHHFGYALENYIFWGGLFGDWEKESLKIWTELSRKSDTIMDVGANTGIYSLISATVNPKSKIYAFEPVERVYKRLNNNFTLNNFKIRSFNIGLSNKDGEAIIYDSYEDHTYSVTINKNLWSKERKVKEVTIPIKTLKSIIEKEGVKKIDLIKIDVETHEYEVLQGMHEYLQMYQPTMLIELLNNEIAGNVESLIKDIGYLYFNIDENGKPKKVNRLTQSDFHNFLICKPLIAKDLQLI